MRRRREEKQPPPSRDDAREAKTSLAAHKAALEALFAPKGVTVADATPARREATRVITVPERADDPVRKERDRLLAKILEAQGRPAITKAADDYLRAGHCFPEDQELHLQLLEHSSEERVAESIVLLEKLVDGEPVKRATVLDARLRRLDEHAELKETRDRAASLRRKLARMRRVG